MNPYIDKIVLSQNREWCFVHIINGPTLYFNFMKLGMTYFEGLEWINEVVGGPTEAAA